MTAARTPAGVPTGGQFAATSHAEPTAGLDVADPGPAQAAPRARDAQRRTDRAIKAYDDALIARSAARTAVDRAARECIAAAVSQAHPTATAVRFRLEAGSTHVVLESVADHDGNELYDEARDDADWPLSAELAEYIRQVEGGTGATITVPVSANPR